MKGMEGKASLKFGSRGKKLMNVPCSLTHKLSRPAFQNLGRFSDIELEKASLRLATAFENLALLTIKEVLILLWAVV